MKLFKIFLNVLKKNIFILIIGLICAGFSMFIGLRIPFISKSIIDDAIGNGDIDLLTKLSIIMVILYILNTIFDLLNIYLFTKVAKVFIRNIYDKLIYNLMLKKNSFFVNQSSGEISQKTSEAWQLEEVFSAEIFSSIFSIITLIVAVIVMVNISLFLTIFAVIGVIISMFFFVLSNYFITKYLPEALDKKITVSSKIQEIILGIFEIRSNGANSIFNKKCKKVIKENCNFGLKFAMGITTFSTLSATFSSLLLVGILYFSGVKIISGPFTLGTYFLYVAYLQKITEPLMHLSVTIERFKRISIVGKRIEKNFSLDSKDRIDKKIYPVNKISKYSLNNLSYTYANSKNSVIENFSLDLLLGDIALLKGPNGSGKSTILNMLSEELLSDTGSILYDDKPGNSLDYVSITRQRPYIFNLSLLDNIVLNEKLDLNKYNEIISSLNFNNYFSKDILDNSLVIKENGNSLSGGQIKLIAFARCIYRSRPILILDEVMSNLDEEIRKLVLKYIKNNKNQLITLIVEHTDDYDTLANKIINLNANRN